MFVLIVTTFLNVFSQALFSLRNILIDSKLHTFDCHLMPCFIQSSENVCFIFCVINCEVVFVFPLRMIKHTVQPYVINQNYLHFPIVKLSVEFKHFLKVFEVGHFLPMPERCSPIIAEHHGRSPSYLPVTSISRSWLTFKPDSELICN